MAFKIMNEMSIYSRAFRLKADEEEQTNRVNVVFERYYYIDSSSIAVCADVLLNRRLEKY